MRDLFFLWWLAVTSACGGATGSDDARDEPDGQQGDGSDLDGAPTELACTPRIENEVPEHFRSDEYVPALTVEGTVTHAGRTWPIESAVLAMAHVRDPDASDRCVVDYKVLAFLERDVPTCVLALHFLNHDSVRNLDEFAFDTSGCAGVAAADEQLWDSDSPVAAVWPTLTGSLLAEDADESCAPATLTFPEMNLPIPGPPATTVAVHGFRTGGPFASQAADWTTTCDAPIVANCFTGDPGPDGVCAPY